MASSVQNRLDTKMLILP